MTDIATVTVPKRRGRPRKRPTEQTVEAAAFEPSPQPTGLSAAPAPAPSAPEAAPPPPPEREEMRAAESRTVEMRADDPRAEAERIAAEWFGHLDSLGPHKDKYYVDPAKFPDGWMYEWRMHSVLGKEDPQYQVYLQRSRFRFVPAKRHPELVPSGANPDSAIIIDGMALMERPQTITDFQKARDKRDAMAPIDNIRAKMAGVPQGQFPRDADPRTAPQIKTEFRPPELAAAKA